jgi:putative Mn2+ efflux pump MntP
LLLGIFAILPLGSIAGAMLSNDDFLFDKALPVIGFLRLVALAAGLWMGISAKKAGSKRKTATVGIVLCALGLLWILGRYIQI